MLIQYFFVKVKLKIIKHFLIFSILQKTLYNIYKRLNFF